MIAETLASELAPQLKALIGEGEHTSSLASAAAFGVAGGAGAVFAVQHHGRVKAERAALRRKG